MSADEGKVIVTIRTSVIDGQDALSLQVGQYRSEGIERRQRVVGLEDRAWCVCVDIADSIVRVGIVHRVGLVPFTCSMHERGKNRPNVVILINR
jgi:hypothetical protein